MTRGSGRLGAILIALVVCVGSRPVFAQEVGSPPEKKPSRAALYTEAQADRGEQVFGRVCAFCHGSGEFAGATFQTTWTGLSVGKLHGFIRSTMPYDNPGRLTPEQYADVVAYILELNAYPAGKDELPVDSKDLDSILLEFK